MPFQNNILAGAAGAGAGGFDVENMTYSAGFNLDSQTQRNRGLMMLIDGSKMYVPGNIGDSASKIHQYSMSSAADISTASYDSIYYAIGVTYDYDTNGTFMHPTGAKWWLYGDKYNDVQEFTMSTAGNISTSSAGTVFSVSSQVTNCYGMTMSSDGLYMYVGRGTTGEVWQYNMGSAWTLSGASYASKTYNFGNRGSSFTGISLSTDGTKAFACYYSKYIYQYTLSTAYDISTATYDSISLDMTSYSTSWNPVWNEDGTILLVAGSSAAGVNNRIMMWE